MQGYAAHHTTAGLVFTLLRLMCLVSRFAIAALALGRVCRFHLGQFASAKEKTASQLKRDACVSWGVLTCYGSENSPGLVRVLIIF